MPIKSPRDRRSRWDRLRPRCAVPTGRLNEMQSDCLKSTCKVALLARPTQSQACKSGRFRTTGLDGDVLQGAIAFPVPRDKVNSPERELIQQAPINAFPGTVTEPEKWTTVAGHACREIEFRFPDGGRAQIWVLYASGDFVLLSSAKSNDRTIPDRFIGSLKFLR
jgi:hypothetical protein